MIKKNKKNLLIYILLADICLLPTWHIFGLPFKFAYVICFFCLFLYITNIRFGFGPNIPQTDNGVYKLKHSVQANKMLWCVAGIIVVTIFGEITTAFYTSLVDISPFRNAIFFYVVLLCCLGIGYVKYDYNKDYLIVVMAVYCIFNILLSALGTSAPSFLLNLYRLSGERGEVLSSLRIGGIMGNPNATLCIMNMLFMSIVVFVQKDLISINNKFKMIFILLLPLITNSFINSRGEFLVTAILEIILIYTILKKSRDLFKTIIWIAVMILLAFLLFNVVFGYLADKYPTVSYSIDRILSIFGGDSGVETDSISDRPFIHADEFIARFFKSPIWGTGFSTGTYFPFERSCQSYHNDWFRIFASGGVLGGIMWIYLIVIAVKKCGLFYLLPFLITANSNTFIGSFAALGIYFMTVMVLIRCEDENREIYNTPCNENK